MSAHGKQLTMRIPEGAEEQLQEFMRRTGFNRSAAGRDIFLRGLASVGHWPPTAKPCRSAEKSP